MWKLHLAPSQTCAPKRAITLAKDFQKKVYFIQAQRLAMKMKEICQGCQITRRLDRAVPYIPKIIRVNSVMERLQIDLIDMAPGTELQMRENFGRFRYISSMTECLTRYCSLVPLHSKTSAEMKPVLQMFSITEGAPKHVHSDNGEEFINSLLHELLERSNVTYIHGAPYHPQSQVSHRSRVKSSHLH